MNIGITEKEFHTLRARAALRGFVLHRTEAIDGPVVFFAERQGAIHNLPTIDALRGFVGHEPTAAKAWRYPRQADEQMGAR